MIYINDIETCIYYEIVVWMCASVWIVCHYVSNHGLLFLLLQKYTKVGLYLPHSVLTESRYIPHRVQLGLPTKHNE